MYIITPKELREYVDINEFGKVYLVKSLPDELVSLYEDYKKTYEGKDEYLKKIHIELLKKLDKNTP